MSEGTNIIRCLRTLDQHFLNEDNFSFVLKFEFGFVV